MPSSTSFAPAASGATSRSNLPPRSTVWRYFDQWRHDGTLDTIHNPLRRKARTAAKPYHPRTSASVDSQSIDATSGGAAGPRQLQERGRPQAAYRRR